MPGRDLKPQVRLFHRVDPSRINDDDLGSLFFSRLDGCLPEDIPVSRPASSPQENASRVLANHGKEAPPKEHVAHDAERAVTDLAGAGVIRRPEKIEESLPDLIVGSSGAARGGNGLGTMLLDDSFEPSADFGESFVPRDLLPFVLTASSRPLERKVQSSGVIEILEHISPARAALGNGVGGFRAREPFIRFDGDKAMALHIAASLQALWHCMQMTFFVSILFP